MGTLPVVSLVYSTWSCLAQSLPHSTTAEREFDSRGALPEETKETDDQPCTYSVRLLLIQDY